VANGDQGELRGVVDDAHKEAVVIRVRRVGRIVADQGSVGFGLEVPSEYVVDPILRLASLVERCPTPALNSLCSCKIGSQGIDVRTKEVFCWLGVEVTGDQHGL